MNPAIIWRSLKGRCDGYQLFAKSTFFAEKFLCCGAISKLLKYRNANGQLRSELNVATSYTTLVRFGPVTPEKHLLIVVLL